MTSSPDLDMKRYYRERAPVYDRVYSYPERQKDLRYLENYVSRQFVDLSVLEVAAGTGYWTQFIASSARTVVAIDSTVDALKQIEDRPDCASVRTEVLDAYSLGDIGSRFEACFAGLWLSHVPVQHRESFIEQLHRVLEPKASVLFIDNGVAQCERLPITHTDKYGNTYQDRQLDNKQSHRVLKNFPTRHELERCIPETGRLLKYLELDHFWLFHYQC